MPFEQEIPYGLLRQTTYGPGSPQPTGADLRERTGIRNIPLQQGDVSLPPEIANKYGLKPGQQFAYGGRVYRYADNPNPRVGNVLDVFYPPTSQRTPGEITDNPFTGGVPAPIPQNPEQDPGTTTDNPFVGGVPPQDSINPAPSERTIYPGTVSQPENVPPSEASTFTNDQYLQEPQNPTPMESGQYPTPIDQYLPPPAENPPPGEGNQFPIPVGQPENVPVNDTSPIPTSIPENVPPNDATPIPTSIPENVAPNESATANPQDVYYMPDPNGGYQIIDVNTGGVVGNLPGSTLSTEPDTGLPQGPSSSPPDSFQEAPSALGDNFQTVNALGFDPSQSQDFSPDLVISPGVGGPLSDANLLPGALAGIGQGGGGNLGNWNPFKNMWFGKRPYTPENFRNAIAWQNSQGNALAGANFYPGQTPGPVTYQPTSGGNYQGYLNTWNAINSGNAAGVPSETDPAGSFGHAAHAGGNLPR